MNFEDIINDYKLTLAEDGKVYVHIIDKGNCIFYPVDIDKCVLVTQDEFMGIIDGTKMPNDDLTGFVDANN